MAGWLAGEDGEAGEEAEGNWDTQCIIILSRIKRDLSDGRKQQKGVSWNLDIIDCREEWYRLSPRSA